MVRITDKQLDMALRMASQYCYEDDIAMMKAVDTQDYPMTEKIQKRFNRMLKKSERRERWADLKFQIPKPVKKVAVILLIIGTLLFTAMMTIQPVRAAIVDVIIRWYDRYIGVLFTAEDTVPTEIKEVILPKDLPEGWSIRELSSNLAAVENTIETDTEDHFRLTQTVIGNEEQWIDNENVSIQNVVISDNIIGTLYGYPDRMILIWRDQYVFILRCDNVNNVDIMIQIAKAFVD